MLIARAAGRPFADFLRQRMFEPLGMDDTGFHVPPEKQDRFVTAYQGGPGHPRADGVLDPAEDGKWSGRPLFPDGGGDLVSTVEDYLVFARMLLGGGRYSGTRLLSRPLVELMTSDQLTPENKARGGLSPGMWDAAGLGPWRAVVTAQTGCARPGQYGWNGGLGTVWFNDPAENLVGILLTPRACGTPPRPRASPRTSRPARTRRWRISGGPARAAGSGSAPVLAAVFAAAVFVVEDEVRPHHRVHHHVPPPPGAEGGAAPHALPREPGLLQRTLLRHVVRLGAGLHPVRLRVREQVLHQRALGGGAVPVPAPGREQRDADVPGERTRRSTHLVPADHAHRPPAAEHHERAAVRGQQTVLGEGPIQGTVIPVAVKPNAEASTASLRNTATIGRSDSMTGRSVTVADMRPMVARRPRRTGGWSPKIQMSGVAAGHSVQTRPHDGTATPGAVRAAADRVIHAAAPAWHLVAP